MTYCSDARDLALHGVRVFGCATAARVAARYGLERDSVEEDLLDFQATGWVHYQDFAGSAGWSLTDAGRAENERRLGAELASADCRGAVTAAHARFVPLNRRFGEACTNWQIRPTRADPLAVNDHTDWQWDERVVRTLTSVAKSFGQLGAELAGQLARYDGYADRYRAALARVLKGQHSWVDAIDRDSCHTVWIQFHEDLLATLGMPRGFDR